MSSFAELSSRADPQWSQPAISHSMLMSHSLPPNHSVSNSYYGLTSYNTGTGVADSFVNSAPSPGSSNLLESAYNSGKLSLAPADKKHSAGLQINSFNANAVYDLLLFFNFPLVIISICALWFVKIFVFRLFLQILAEVQPASEVQSIAARNKITFSTVVKV